MFCDFKHVVFGVVLCLLSACLATNNAIHELTVDFPTPFSQNPDGTGARVAFARIRVASGSEGVPFDDVFDSARATEVFALGSQRRLSVVGQESQFTRSLRIRVDYCVDTTCAQVAFSRRYELERVFYRAKFTGMTLAGSDDVAAIRAGGAPVFVERCKIFGCSSEILENYCVGGVHACE